MSLILDLVFPRKCYGCHRPGQYLCQDCRSKIIIKSIVHQPKTNLEGRLSLFRYYGIIKDIITDIKFNFVTDIISELGDHLCNIIFTNYPHLLQYWQDNNYTLVPIPLHPNRQNWRGFNQSQLLCQTLSSKLKLDYNPDILIRTKNTTPQTSITDKHLRRSNISTAFTYTYPNCPPFQGGIKRGFDNIILVDDVYTTGSTIYSAISAFPEKTQIWALTLAG